MFRDLIIGCATNYDWNTIKYWVNSINKSGFDGDKFLILMNCDKETAKNVMDAGFMVIGFEQDEEGNLKHENKIVVNVERFLHIYHLLTRKDYRYVITTDVKDVIFQKNPIEFIEQNIGDKNLIFSSRSIKFKDDIQESKNLLETFGPFFHGLFENKETYNVGVLAGKAESMRDLCCMIFNMSTNRPVLVADQTSFNFMVSQEPYKSTCLYTKSEDGWAAQLGTTVDPSKILRLKSYLLEPSPKMVDDKVVTSTGKEFTIVHQYDLVPEWKKIIEEKYSTP